MPTLQLPLCSTKVGIAREALVPELFGTGCQSGAPGSKTSQHPECSGGSMPSLQGTELMAYNGRGPSRYGSNQQARSPFMG